MCATMPSQRAEYSTSLNPAHCYQSIFSYVSQSVTAVKVHKGTSPDSDMGAYCPLCFLDCHHRLEVSFVPTDRQERSGHEQQNQTSQTPPNVRGGSPRKQERAGNTRDSQRDHPRRNRRLLPIRFTHLQSTPNLVPHS